MAREDTRPSVNMGRVQASALVPFPSPDYHPEMATWIEALVKRLDSMNPFSFTAVHSWVSLLVRQQVRKL